MRSDIRDRRAFLRHAAALGWVSTIGGLGGCLDGVPALDSTETGTDSDAAADALDLRAGVEIGTVFTALGGQLGRSEVNPDEPGGGRLISIDAVEPGEQVTLTWRETVEQEVTPAGTPDAGVGTPTPTPDVETVERTGTITATGLAAAHESLLPMFWEPGETVTGTSAMWLSREAFRELVETRRTAWSPDVLTRITWVGKEVQERIHGAVEQVGEDEVYLEADADFVDFEVTVADQRTTVRAIRALDTFGNEYVVLGNEANPLVVKFTYNAVSVGVTGFDTGLWSLIKAVFSGYQVVSLDPP